MDEKMMESVLYSMMLLIYGTGWMLLLFRNRSEMENRGTLLGMVQMLAKRIWKQLPRREWLIKKIREKRNALQRPVLELEIFTGSILLKNLILAEKETPFSADYLLEKLMEHSRRLKPVYGRMLAMYRSGRDREAFSLLGEFCGTRSAGNFSAILSKLDQIAPDELTEQIAVFQEIMEQQRVTAAMKQVQRNSTLITSLAAASMFVMMIDFTVVVVFMHTITLLESVF